MKADNKAVYSKKYKVALFDMDGTLVDTYEGIENSLRYAFDKLGEPMVENPKCFIGPPLNVSFSQFCGYDHEKTNKAIEYYREYYAKQGINECKLYDGICDLLKALDESGVIVGVATSKPMNFAHRVAQNLGIDKYIKCLAGASEDEKTRTSKEQVLEYAIGLLECIDKRDIVMIGDRHFDINGAKQFDLDSIGVTFGFGDEEELRKAGATYIAHNCEEIQKIILL